MPATAAPSVTDKVRLLIEWSPAITLAAAVASAKVPRDRVAALMALLAFAARKTELTLDDDLVTLVQSMLLTQEGGALVDYIANVLGGLIQQAQYEQSRYSGV